MAWFQSNEETNDQFIDSLELPLIHSSNQQNQQIIVHNNVSIQDPVTCQQKPHTAGETILGTGAQSQALLDMYPVKKLNVDEHRLSQNTLAY